MFDSHQIESVLVIAEEQSLTRAADRLFVTQSALSQQLAKLRKQGLPPLFRFENGKMQPTDAGRIYLNSARSIMHLKEQCLEELRRDGSEDRL